MKIYTLVKGIYSATFVIGEATAFIKFTAGGSMTHSTGRLSLEAARRKWKRLLQAGYTAF